MENLAQQELLNLCLKWSADLKGIDRQDGRMAYFRAELPRLLARRGIFEGILRGVQAGSPYPDLRQETLFDNELILFRDQGRMFSLRLYLFGPGEHTAVHDHTSWGVSGPAIGQLEVVCYRRAGPEPARRGLTLAGRRVIRPGEVETTLPFDDGIHRTGNPAEGSTLMVSVYGRPLRRLYIQCFDPENGQVDRLYPPHLKKRMLAEQALQSMQAERGQENDVVTAAPSLRAGVRADDVVFKILK
jgi:predicted metal-dependent enzyme (double-stranded beta helix superfamily)